MSVEGKKVVLVVTGGIAAYKAADLASQLKKAGAEVRVVMTRAARRFVAPLTFEAITGGPVYRKVFGQATSHRMEHIEWARWADCVIVAPATADFMARIAHGLAGDAAATLYLAFTGPVWIAPAMNTAMWEHPATQTNLKILKQRGVRLIGPGFGPLACGEVGEGRMADPQAIVQAIGAHASPAFSDEPSPTSAAQRGPLSGSRVLITAGPTREALDPIRFISNRSTGLMGAALAETALGLGAEVILIHGPMQAAIPDGVRAIAVEDAQSMLAAVREHLASCKIAIFAAAVANYRSAETANGKIKGDGAIELRLTRTPDVAAWAGANRNGRDQLLVGFSADSENVLESAQSKLKEKKLDLIFANPIGEPGVGFGAESNSVTLVTPEGPTAESGRMDKSRVARWIWDRLCERL